jgi:GT2 family glycosyltransferase
MDVSIVIPTWRGRHLLEAYIPSVIAASNHYRKNSRGNTEILIVEDAGGDDTVSWLKARYGSEVRILEHEENLGFCSACQTGFLHASCPLVLLLNNDVRLEADCIAPMVEHFENPGVFAVTGKMFNQKGDVFCNGGKVARFRCGMWSSYRNYDVLPGVGTDSSLLSFTAIGAFSLFDRGKFLKVGGFDSLAAMVEDVEISYRGWKRGWLIKYEPRSVAYHDASQTMNRRFGRRSLDKLSRRSRIMMHWLLLHDRSMFGQHIANIGFRFLVSWLWLDWPFYWAIFTGFQNIGTIRRKRCEYRQTAVRSDREVLQLLDRFYRTAPITERNA